MDDQNPDVVRDEADDAKDKVQGAADTANSAKDKGSEKEVGGEEVLPNTDQG
ncbi:hypothetical protein [Leucobacter sp. USHLN153]|uniref:hypothetical protein n=1 Tax=Leucobacter sp. USHLN153 TaxID=3081268 RepID=UPI00301B218E